MGEGAPDGVGPPEAEPVGVGAVGAVEPGGADAGAFTGVAPPVTACCEGRPYRPCCRGAGGGRAARLGRRGGRQRNVRRELLADVHLLRPVVVADGGVVRDHPLDVEREAVRGLRGVGPPRAADAPVGVVRDGGGAPVRPVALGVGQGGGAGEQLLEDGPRDGAAGLEEGAVAAGGAAEAARPALASTATSSEGVPEEQPTRPAARPRPSVRPRAVRAVDPVRPGAYLFRCTVPGSLLPKTFPKTVCRANPADGHNVYRTRCR